MRTFFFFLVLFCSQLWAANPVDYAVDICQYSDSKNNPYLEIYVSLKGASLIYQPVAGGFKASAKVGIGISKVSGKDTTLTYTDSVNVHTPVLSDTSAASLNKLYHHLLRVSLPAATYTLAISAEDHQKQRLRTSRLYVVEVLPVAADSLSLSDILYLSEYKKTTEETVFTKNGYLMIPFGTEDFFFNENTLQFYTEIYNSDKSVTGDYTVTAQIKRGNTVMYEYVQTVRKKPQKIDVFYGKFDISRLSSQMYILEIVAREKARVLHSTARKIYISNDRVAANNSLLATAEHKNVFEKYTDDELNYYVSTLFPISSEQEQNTAQQLENRAQRVGYLAAFWEKRETEEAPMIKLWMDHYNKVQFADQNYGNTRMKGSRSNMGQVLIKYGIPSNREQFPSESSLLPYEIWRYDRVKNQYSVIFIFADRLGFGQYDLIHSNCYGELSNPNWRDQLQGGGVAPGQGLDEGRRGNDSGYDTKLNPFD